jgi:CRP-like cAMP-binding protein
MTDAPANEAFTLLRGIDVLASVPDDAQREVAAAMTAVSLPEGGVLVRLGEVADSMFVVAEGELEVRLPVKGGGERVVAVLGRGRGIGEMQMVSGGTRVGSSRGARPACIGSRGPRSPRTRPSIPRRCSRWSGGCGSARGTRWRARCCRGSAASCPRKRSRR